MSRRVAVAVLVVCCFAALGWAPSAYGLTVTIQADKAQVPMGRDVRVEATVTDDDGRPLAGCLLLPYVNERRWGSHERTDASGRTAFTLPLPNPGPAQVKVLLRTTEPASAAEWIWAADTQDSQTVFLAKTFSVDGPVTGAKLYVAADDAAEVLLNGVSLGKAEGTAEATEFSDLAGKLQPGENVLAIRASNASGIAAVAAQLEIDGAKQHAVYPSDATWQVWTEQPADWPKPHSPGAAATVVNAMDRASAPGVVAGWPGYVDIDELLAGTLIADPLPAGTTLSNTLNLTVTQRAIAPHPPSDRLVGVQWEPWMTPMNAYWQTAQAVPVMGCYSSYNRDVQRQQVLWFCDLGVDFIMPDWSNHIWGRQHWSERNDGSNEIIHATNLMLETLAEMRDEGLPVPKVVLMPGLTNGPPTTMTAINEQLAWIYNGWVRNPRFNGLWVDYDGKPLIVILDTLTHAQESPVPVDETHWTVRWMSTQLQRTHHEEIGYWSWMDGSLQPIVTYRDGKPEVITVTPAYFGEGGWLYPEARGRLGGTTYIESFKPAIEVHPRVLLLHQWNEYAGQVKGNGYGDKKDIYVDSYSGELSDDLEPTSLTAPAYRNDAGGWGYLDINLTQALLSLYRGETPDDTILAVGSPARNQAVASDSLAMDWAVAGVTPKSYSVLVDGHVVADSVKGTAYTLDLSGLAPGAHTVSVIANGASTHFPLSLTEFDVPLKDPVEPRVDVPILKAAK